jgi:hypothetical protein
MGAETQEFNRPQAANYNPARTPLRTSSDAVPGRVSGPI